MAEAVGQRDKLNVFISYSRDDLQFADQLDAALGLAGVAASIDRQGIFAGEDWQTRLGALIRDSDTVIFVLSPSSARSKTCAWEVEEAVRLGKRILPVLCRSLDDASPPPQLAKLNYIYFYNEPRFPGAGFGKGLVDLASALNTDLDWLREHTRYLQRATEWDGGGRSVNRLLSGPDIASAKAWAARRPNNAPDPTELQLDFIKASEAEDIRHQSTEAQRLQEIAEAQAERGKALTEREQAQKSEAEAREAESESLKREAEQARRVAQRTRLGLAAVSVLAVAAFALMFYAVGQRNRASEQHDLAVARQLATEARVTFEQGGESATDLQRSLLLATASLEFAGTQEGFLAWSNAIELLPPTTPVLGPAEGPFGAVAFSRDGGRVAVAEKESIVVMDSASLAEASEPKILARLPQAGAMALAFKPPDGDVMISGMGPTAVVWSLADSRRIKELPTDHRSQFASLAFDSRGKRLASAGNFYYARVFETEDWNEIGRVGNESAMAVAFSPDDRWLLTAGSQVVAWDVGSAMRKPDAGASREPVDPKSFSVVAEHGVSPYFVSFSGDGQWLAGGGGLRHVDSSDTATRFGAAEPFSFSSNPVIAISSDASVAATSAGSDEVSIRRIDPDGKHFSELGRIVASKVAFAPTAQWLISAADNGLERWNLAAGAEWRRLVHEAALLDLAVSLDARFLATTTADGFAHVWETTSWREAFKAEIHRTEGGDAASSVAFSADGRWLAAASQKVVKVFATADWREIASIELPGSIVGAAFSADSKWLVAQGEQGPILIAANTWAPSRFPSRVSDRLAISPDGRQLVISHEPYCERALQIAGSAQLWEISSGQKQGEAPFTDDALPCHPNGNEKPEAIPADALRGADWRNWKPLAIRAEAPGKLTSPDGAWIVAHEFGGDSIELSPASVGDRPGVKHRAGAVTNMAFSPKSKWLVTASGDGVARIWTLDRKAMIAESCARLKHDLSPDDWRRILGEEPYAPVCPGLPAR
jgi:WD40 repeat protein